MSKLVPVTIVLAVASVLLGFAAPPAQLVIDARCVPLHQPPLVENDVIMVPFRPIFEAFGWTVTWNNEKKTAAAMLGKRIVQVTISQNQATIDGVPARLKTAVKLVNGWTMVPALFVEQALRVSVNWDPKGQTLTIGATQRGQGISLEFSVTNP
ncbi:MAG: hypothetical protein PWQ13_286 [Bacillota bacterium]|nr:hypothetical protein [Bacillota bacterium]